MRHYFFDTSAFVKRYALEPGSRVVGDLLQSAKRQPSAVRVFVSELVHPETVSALSQIVHGPEPAKYGLSRAAGWRAVNEIAQDLGDKAHVHVVRVGGMMLRAADLVWKHRITGADAVHLAAALTSRSLVRNPGEFYFVSADRRQGAAAAAEGLAVIDPTG